MNYGEIPLKVSIPTTSDLSAFQYRVVSLDGTLCSAIAEAAGIMLNKPVANQNCEVGVIGELPGVAGASISAKALLKVVSGGFLITATSGSGVVGKNLNYSVASGEAFRFIGNFITSRTEADTA